MNMIQCLRCGQNAPGIGDPKPYPGELGKTIAEHVCQACWDAWKKFSVNVINDYKLRPFLPQDRAVVERHMKQYLNLELQGLQPPSAHVVTLEGQGVAVTFNTNPEGTRVSGGPKSEGLGTGANDSASGKTDGGRGERVVSLTAVKDMLEQIFDPEIPVNIYDLGLIYGIDIRGDEVDIRMTLTSQHCPAAQSLPATVREAVARIPGVREVDVTVIWDPPWTKEKISEEGRKILGI